MVISEPAQPMMPRYITRIDAPISNCRVALKVCSKFWVADVCRLSVRNMQALANVNINRVTPMPNTVIPKRLLLFLRFLSMFR